MTRHNPNRQAFHCQYHNQQPIRPSASTALARTNNATHNGFGKLDGVDIMILSPQACQDRITAAIKFLQETYGFTFDDRDLLAEALQPATNEDLAFQGDRAQTFLIARQFRAAQKAYDNAAGGPPWVLYQRRQQRQQQQHGNHRPTRKYCQNGVSNVVGCNVHQAFMCANHALHHFMFVKGPDDCDGSGVIHFGLKPLADTMEALMGVIAEDGRQDWEGDLTRWMRVFGLDWECAPSYRGRYSTKVDV